jgi:CRISPR/Cas system CMR subunit Cmr6 (Cas7 group RAMP superfamily)
MSTMAQALAKAGIVNKEEANGIGNLRKAQEEVYRELSKDISQLFRQKKEVKTFLDALVGAGNASLMELDLMVTKLFGLENLNLVNEVNRKFVLDIAKKDLEKYDRQLTPLLKQSRTLEKDWGFTRY